MPTVSSRTQAGALLEATAGQARMVNSVIHQFKFGFNPTPTTSLTEFQAQECDYDGYAPITMATWAAPVLAPSTGYMTFGPQVTFRWAHVSADVTNAVGGYWTETAAGVVTDYVIYNGMKPMNGPGASDTQTPVQVYPAQPVSS